VKGNAREDGLVYPQSSIIIGRGTGGCGCTIKTSRSRKVFYVISVLGRISVVVVDPPLMKTIVFMGASVQ
jgi:hypothetical protein